MTARSAKQELVTDRLGEPVEAWLARHRQNRAHRVSWSGLALMLERETDVRVTGETLRQWYDAATKTTGPRAGTTTRGGP